MTLKLGYLLPTRERIMAGIHRTRDIIGLAVHAEHVGLDSVWVGDSLLAKPRHEPLALAAAIAASTDRIVTGTAVLLPMLRNPVLLAHQVATIDQIAEGRFILGVGIARDTPAIRNEFVAAGVPFEKRVGTLMEAMRLCRALWEGRDPVNWEGRWTVKGAELAPVPFSPGGPAIWGGGGAPAALRRAGRHFDGWFPSGPGNGKDWGRGWRQVLDDAADGFRTEEQITGAAYVTVSVDERQTAADAALDAYLSDYYLAPAERIRREQYCYAGSLEATTDWLREFVDAGATHLCVRFTGANDREQMETLAAMKEALD